MRYLMFNFLTNNILWIFILVGVILLIVALSYIYYKLKIRLHESNDEIYDYDNDSDNDNIDDYYDKDTEVEEDLETVESQEEEIEEEKEEVQPKKEEEQDEVSLDSQDTASDNEILVQNEKGDTIEIFLDDKGMKYIFVKDNKILAMSDYYHTKPGLFKGLKSLVNYKDTLVINTLEGEDVKPDNASFEIFKDDNNQIGYYLKTKNLKVKLTGLGFKSTSECIDAINSVKSIYKDFSL